MRTNARAMRRVHGDRVCIGGAGVRAQGWGARPRPQCRLPMVTRIQKNPAIADRGTADTWAFAGRRVPAHAIPSSAAMVEFKSATVWRPSSHGSWLDHPHDGTG